MREIETIYISLQEATRYCNYSQEYLSLRARQKKLKAVKFGRIWLTKKEWLENYLRKVEAYKTKKVAPPPENLPIEEKITRVGSVQFRPALAFVLVFLLLITGIAFALRQAQGNPELAEWIGKDSFKYTFEAVLKNLSLLAVEFNENFIKTIPETVLLAGVNTQDILEITVDTFKEFSQWLISLF